MGEHHPAWKFVLWVDGLYLLEFPNSVQFSCSVMSTLCNPMNCSNQASLSITNSRSSPKLMSIESVMPSSHLILCRPLLLLPLVFPSIRVFSNESALRIRWPKHWSFSFSISPSNDHPGLISFRMDWLDLLGVQRTLKSLRNIKKEVCLHSDFGWLWRTLSNCWDCLMALTLATVTTPFGWQALC